MTLPLPADPAAADGLRLRYPNWDIHQSGVGRWWAMTRDRSITPGDGMRAYMDADTVDALDDLLAEQERLRGRSAGDGPVGLA